jgi:hypothetical protein
MSKLSLPNAFPVSLAHYKAQFRPFSLPVAGSQIPNLYVPGKVRPEPAKSQAFCSLVTLVGSNETGFEDIVLLVFGASEFGRLAIFLSCLSLSYFSAMVLRPQRSHFEETLCCSRCIEGRDPPTGAIRFVSEQRVPGGNMEIHDRQSYSRQLANG